MNIDTAKAMKDLVAKGIKIPPQPGVLIALRKMVAKSDANVRALASVIALDLGISAMLFRAARSPVFGRGKKLSSIEEVIMTVGVKQTFNLVQAMALTCSVSDKTRNAYAVFWTRSQEIAALAAIIAKDRVSICNVFPDQAYMAGIFHECGVPILMQRFPDYCQELQFNKTSCWPTLAEEDARYQVDHCSIGYIVARHWALPEFICAAIRYHYEIPRDEVSAACALVAIIQLAGNFYLRLNNVEDPLWATLRSEVLKELGLDAEGEQEYFEEISERFLSQQ